MKHFATLAIMWLLSFLAVDASAQTGSKPKQFSQFPDVITCTEAQLSRIFDATAGQTIQIPFSGNFSFDGPVINNVVKYSNLQSAVIQSPAFNNSIFSVSRITNSDRSVTYVGRIINKNYFDGYELKRDASGNYRLIKVETDRVMPDCAKP